MKQKENVLALDKLGAVGIFLMVAVWGFGFGFYEFHAWSSSHSTHVREVASTQKTTSPEKSLRKMETDLSLGGLDLDMTVDEVHKAIGKEDTIKTKNKYHFLEYANMEVGVRDDNIVHSLVSNGSSVQTKRGIHEGSTFAEVKKAYGTDYYKMDNDDLTLYEYPFKSLKGHDGLLRFAIKKSDQTVQYISVRIPEDETQAKNDSSKTRENDAKLATTVLNSYYQGITNGRELNSYRLLTSSRQKKMGTFEQFKKGFETTLSHRVDRLQVDSATPGVINVSYLMTARDRLDNFGRVQVRTFQCTATIVKESDAWRIDDMTAKKVSESVE